MSWLTTLICGDGRSLCRGRPSPQILSFRYLPRPSEICLCRTACSHSPTNVGGICRRHIKTSETFVGDISQARQFLRSTNHCKRYRGQPRPFAQHALDGQQRRLLIDSSGRRQKLLSATSVGKCEQPGTCLKFAKEFSSSETRFRLRCNLTSCSSLLNAMVSAPKQRVIDLLSVRINLILEPLHTFADRVYLQEMPCQIEV